MHISTVIMFRRTITPISPTAKSVPERRRYMAVLGKPHLRGIED
jgi:hypothetical protein